MKNTISLFYIALISIFTLIYIILEFSMRNAEGGSGLGAYLLLIGAALVHLIILVGVFIVKKVKNKKHNNILFTINIILVLLVLFRLFFLV